MDDERLISLSEAAALCGLTSTQLRFLARRGTLRARKVGRNWITTPRAVAEYMANDELRSKDPHKYKRG